MKFFNLINFICIIFVLIEFSFENKLPNNTIQSKLNSTKNMRKRACMITPSGRQICTAPKCFPDGTCIGK
jgi:hypothetical protein